MTDKHLVDLLNAKAPLPAGLVHTVATAITLASSESLRMALLKRPELTVPDLVTLQVNEPVHEDIARVLAARIRTDPDRTLSTTQLRALANAKTSVVVAKILCEHLSDTQANALLCDDTNPYGPWFLTASPQVAHMVNALRWHIVRFNTEPERWRAATGLAIGTAVGLRDDLQPVVDEISAITDTDLLQSIAPWRSWAKYPDALRHFLTHLYPDGGTTRRDNLQARLETQLAAAVPTHRINDAAGALTDDLDWDVFITLLTTTGDRDNTSDHITAVAAAMSTP